MHTPVAAAWSAPSARTSAARSWVGRLVGSEVEDESKIPQEQQSGAGPTM